jgi:uncharacterized protein (TIGR00255 family)
MPLRSMTGFGAAARPLPGFETPTQLDVEARSVNGRHLDLRIRQPFGVKLEHALRSRLEARFGRGRIELTVALRHGAASPEHGDDSLGAVGVDRSRVLAVLRAAAEITALAGREKLEVSPLNPLEVLRFLATSSRGSAAESQAPEPPSFLDAVVDEALDALAEFRSREGAALAGVLAGLAADLRGQVDRIGLLARDEPARWSERVRARVRELLAEAGSSTAIDDGRIAHEVALLAARSDVAEELARLDIHLRRIAEVLAAPAASGQGRTLEFVAQELLREVTTIGSKIGSHDGAGIVIDAKGTIERIREQVANVE